MSGVEQPVILSALEQDYLLRAIEAAVRIRDLHQFFLWTQGQLQGLLPHQLMACMQFGPGGALLRIESLHGSVLPAAALRRLCDPDTGLSPRLAAHCLAHQHFPCHADSVAALAPFQQEIDACGYDNLLLHACSGLPGGATVFVLYGMPQRPGPRQAYFLELLLPYMHVALLRVAASGAPSATPAIRPLSGREVEILTLLRQGKDNAAIAAVLTISPLTVKNHLQRIYKLLAVSNRTEAVARCNTLRLLVDAN